MKSIMKILGIGFFSLLISTLYAVETPPATPVLNDTTSPDTNQTQPYFLTIADIENKSITFDDNCTIDIYANNTMSELCQGDTNPLTGGWQITNGILQIQDTEGQWQIAFENPPALNVNVMMQEVGEPDEYLKIVDIQSVDQNTTDNNQTTPTAISLVNNDINNTQITFSDNSTIAFCDIGYERVIGASTYNGGWDIGDKNVTLSSSEDQAIYIQFFDQISNNPPSVIINKDGTFTQLNVQSSTTIDCSQVGDQNTTSPDTNTTDNNQTSSYYQITRADVENKKFTFDDGCSLSVFDNNTTIELCTDDTSALNGQWMIENGMLKVADNEGAYQSFFSALPAIGVNLTFQEYGEPDDTVTITAIETVDTNDAPDSGGTLSNGCTAYQWQDLNDTCHDIIAPSETELNNGIWHEMIKENFVSTGKYAACVDISLSGGSGSLSFTELEKSGSIYTENESITSYDATKGSMVLEFEEDGRKIQETVYLTYFDSNKARAFLLERDKNSGILEVFRELENKASCDTANLEYTDDYENYNDSKAYQVSGYVTLPTESDYNVHMQARNSAGQWLSHSEINEDNNGSYMLGFDNSGDYLIEANIDANGQWENYFYDGLTNTWISGKTVDFDPVINGQVVDDEAANASGTNIDFSQVFEWVPQVNFLTVDSNITDVNLNLAALEDAFYKIQGSVVVASDFNATEFCRNNSDQLGICEWTNGGVQGSGYNNWAGENGIRIEITNALTGEWVTETRITNSSNESNSTATSKTLDFEVKLPSYGEYIIRVNKQTFDETAENSWEQQKWEGFYFNPTTGKLIDDRNINWKETDTTDNWGNTIWAPDTDVTGKLDIDEVSEGQSKITLLSHNINFVSFLDSQVKFGGTINFDSGELYVEMINLSTGNYFGWENLRPENSDFNITLPSTEIGDKYAFRVSLSTSHSWESYYIDLTDVNNPKFVPEHNINWKSYKKNSEGILEEYDSGDWTPDQIWLPDLTQIGALTLTDTNTDGQITQADISSLTLDFAAMDDQFYILDGQVVVPDTFTPGEVCKLSGGSIGYQDQCWNDPGSKWLGWNNVNFEVKDKNTGESIAWQDINRDSNQTDGSNKTYDYKIKLLSAGEFIVRVNYENYDIDTQSTTWSSYFVNYTTNPISLISDRKVQHIPVLKDKDGNDLIPNGKTNNSCWNEGNFWWQAEGDDDGSCYDEHPYNWIPDSTQTGFVTLNDTNKTITEVINFVTIANDLYKITGTVTVPSGFEPSHDWKDRKMIRVEAMNASTGEWLGNGHISESPISEGSNEYKYSFILEDVSVDTNVTIKLVKEEQDSDGQWDWESYFINFGADNSVGGAGENADTLISEETVKWVEVEQSTKDWNMWLPNPEQTGFITLDTNKTIVLDIDYSSMVGDYETNKKSIYGVITLSEAVILGQVGNTWYWNNIRVEAINKNNGQYISDTEAECNNSSSCTELTYELELSDVGDYLIRISKHIDGKWEEYYYNFGEDHNVSGENTNADKIIDGQKVNWVEAADKINVSDQWKNWMPNPDKTGWINFQDKAEVNIDFSAFENSILSISGIITVPNDFIIGEYCTNDLGEEGRCDWQTGYQNGYTSWSGAKRVRIEAINKSTGDWIASQDIIEKIENENRYSFKLKLGDVSDVGNDFVIKFNKEQNTPNSWKNDEIFYQFGTNHTFEGLDSSSDGEKLVNGRKIQWIETSSNNEWGYKNWMPNPDETGWLNITTSLTGMDVDLSTFGVNDYYLKGKVTFKADFNISNDNSWADVSVIDSTTGKHVGNTPIKQDGTYELNLGEEAGDFVMQVNYSYNDYENWQNSWWKNKYYDFGADKAYGGGDDSLLTDMEVRWVPVLGSVVSEYTQDHKCWQSGNFWDYDAGENAACYPQPEHWRPNANPITVNADTTTQVGTKKIISGIDIDLSAKIGSSLDINITNLPAQATNTYVYVTNPTSQSGGNWQHLDGSSITLEELKDGSYTVEFGYDLDGKYYNYFIKDLNSDLTDGVEAVLGMEVRWEELDSATHAWGPSATDTTYINLNSDLNLSITIPTIVLNDVNITLNNVENDENVNLDFKSTTKPYGRWESTTSGNSKAVFSFSDVKDDDYFASFWYDGNQYVCDGANCESMKKDPQWIAMDGDTQMCPKANNDWDCDWDQSHNWNWMPDVTPLTVLGNTEVNATIPAMKKVTGAINLSDDFANANVHVSIFKHNGNDWNWENYTLNENGDVNGSMKVVGGDDYRIEIWIDGLGGYVFTESGWISQNNSWSENNTTHMWEPKPETLIDINADKDLGIVTIGSDYKTVTVVVENLDQESGSIVENVWISLESDSQGYYGEDNANWDVHPVTYDGNVTLKVPASSDYKLLVFPMNHIGGYVSNGDGNDNDTISSGTTLYTIGWNEKDLIDVTNSTTITVSLPAAADLGSIDGNVTCGSTDCSGWIDAFDDNFGKGSPVNSDGTFEIKGMIAGTYEVNYWAYAQDLNGLMLQKTDVVVTSGSVTTITLAKEASDMYSSITGKINDQDAYAILIKTDGTSWEVIATKEINESGDFIFGELPKPATGKTYLVAAAKRTKSTDYSSSVQFTQPIDLVTSQNVDISNLDFGDLLTGVTVTGQTNE